MLSLESRQGSFLSKDHVGMLFRKNVAVSGNLTEKPPCLHSSDFVVRAFQIGCHWSRGTAILGPIIVQSGRGHKVVVQGPKGLLFQNPKNLLRSQGTLCFNRTYSLTSISIHFFFYSHFHSSSHLSLSLSFSPSLSLSHSLSFSPPNKFYRGS